MSWNGVKQQINKAEIEAWCKEMGIKDYTINSQGEIDVNGDVWFMYKRFKELPYKFGKVTGYFDIGNNPNLISLKNCPNHVSRLFACDVCPQLNSLEGCPKEVNDGFYCKNCKRKFTKKYISSLCKVKGGISNL